MINALHVFAVSYFTGNVKITAKEVAEQTRRPRRGERHNDGLQGRRGGEGQRTTSPGVCTAEPPKCPPEQKQKVTNAINAYVQAAQAAPAKQ